MGRRNMDEHSTSIEWSALEAILREIEGLHGLAYVVMVANDDNDIYTDAVTAVYYQAGRVREMFKAEAFPESEAER